MSEAEGDLPCAQLVWITPALSRLPSRPSFPIMIWLSILRVIEFHWGNR
jgi:hypothetical protein